jgi:glycerol uptake facilitator-like aquaporin
MTDDRWEDARRLEAWAGEVRVNLIRAAALIAFYGYHLLNVFVLTNDATLKGAYNAKVTCIAAAWALAVFALYVCLTRRWAPPALKYVATAWDLAMITALLLVDKTAGPHSPLIVLYFLVVAAAPLRLSIKLVYAATLGAMLAATFMMGCYVFVLIGKDEYYKDAKAVAEMRPAEIIFLLALGGAGLLAGQVVRQARRLVGGHPVTVEKPREAA